MIRRIPFLFSVALVFCALPGAAPAHAQNNARLQQTLAQLDTASASFKSATAEFTSDFYEAVVRDHTIQNGAIYFERSGSSMQMGSYVFLPGTQTKERIIEYKAGVLRIFDPKVNQVSVFRSTASQTDTYLTLGFGGSGKDLSRAWDITDDGPMQLPEDGHNVTVEKLELVSKDPGVRSNFSKITLWIDLKRGVSLKQIFDTPSGDSRTATYTHIAVNGHVDKGAFALHTDGHTTVINH
jgi:outer membrane lipoprotein-sorting protein